MQTEHDIQADLFVEQVGREPVPPHSLLHCHLKGSLTAANCNSQQKCNKFITRGKNGKRVQPTARLHLYLQPVLLTL